MAPRFPDMAVGPDRIDASDCQVDVEHNEMFTGNKRGRVDGLYLIYL